MKFHRQLTTSMLLALLVPLAQAASIVGALDDGFIGLHGTKEMRLETGACTDCASIPQALWYFKDELVAVPGAGSELRSIIWLGSSHVVPKAELQAGGKQIALPDKQRFTFAVTPKIDTNLSYFNEDSLAYLSRRSLRLRGEIEEDGQGQKRFVARTIWPLDFRISPLANQQPLGATESLRTLVKADNGGARQPFSSRLLWEKSPGIAKQAQGKTVLGIMLNGAQGDDDEAHGGHFAIATGRFREDGDWSRWLTYNFYALDSYGEKGIIAAPTPMDKYLLDLNNGQSWYRPSYMLVAVLRDEKVARDYQSSIEQVFNHFYRHDIDYNHSASNCAGISIDVLRKLGWNVPAQGHESLLKAIGAYFYVSITNFSLRDGRKIYDYFREEPTRLYPAASFDALGADLLALAGGNNQRALTEFEKRLGSDIEAIYFVRIPQIPSSRAFGLAPVYSFDEYMSQAPADRSQWKIIPVTPRPFPQEMRDGAALEDRTPALIPLPVALATLLLIGLATVIIKLIRHKKSG